MKSILSSDLSASIRYLKRRPTYTILSIVGLSVGIAASFLIGLWIVGQFSHNAFHSKADNLYRVTQSLVFGEETTQTAALPAGLAPIIEEEQPKIRHAVRFRERGEVRVSTGERDVTRYDDQLLFADASVFQVFDFPLSKGSPRRALDQPNAIVLSASAARDYFQEQNPIGQSIIVGDTLEFTVAGVAENPPPSSTIQFRFLASFQTLEHLEASSLADWGANQYPTYLLLHPDASVRQVESDIENVLMTRATPKRTSAARVRVEPITGTYFSDVKPAFGSSGDRRVVYAFLFVGLLILGTSLFNFATLTAAYARSRIQEIGVRQSLGAMRKDILTRFVSESFILSAGGVLLAAVWVVLIVVGVRHLFPPLDVAHLLTLWSGVSVSALALMVAALSGVAPVLHFSRRNPSDTLTGDQHNLVSNLVRRLLVTLQFTVCITLITVTVLAWNQVSFMKTARPGLQPENVVIVPLRGTSVSGSKALTLRDQLLSHADVVSASVTSTVPASRRKTKLTVSSGQVDGVPITAMIADGKFVDVLRLDIVKGTGFEGRRADRSRVLLNETAVHALGLQAPIGTTIRYQGGQVERTITGVVRDFKMSAMRETVEPVMIEYGPGMYAQHVVLRTRDDALDRVMSTLEPTWASIAPAYPLRAVFLEEEFASLYESDHRSVELFGIFSLLAVLVALIGLFGLTSFTVRRREREIAVRRTFGATSLQVLQHLSRRLLALVGAGFLLAVPITWLTLQYWLGNYAYLAPANPLAYAASGLAVGLTILATFIASTLPVLRTDPAAVLRSGE